MSKTQGCHCHHSFAARAGPGAGSQTREGHRHYKCQRCKEAARGRQKVTCQCDMCGRAHKVHIAPGTSSAPRKTRTFTCHECAQVKRERERDRGKHIKMKFQPQKVVVEFTGYQTEELVKAFGSMGVASGITDKPQQKKLPSTHKRYFH